MLFKPFHRKFYPRLLAEGIRLYEANRGELLGDPKAEERARSAEGDLERRLILRAEALPVAEPLGQAFHQLKQALAAALLMALILGLISGAAAARATLGETGETVNFFWVLSGLLGVQLLALLIWLGLLLVRPRAIQSGSLLGRLVLGVGRQLDQRLHRGPTHMAAVQALSGALIRSSLGRWGLSAVSHAIWLAFVVGALVMVLLVLSTRQYNFVWETTILSEHTYVPLTRAVAALPDGLGFTTPTPEQIRESRPGADPTLLESDREAWSGLLVGSLVAYGLLPRLGFLLLSVGLARWAAGRFRLDTSLPGYVRLESRLMPAAASIGVVDAEHRPASVQETVTEKTATFEPEAESGPLALLGLELDPAEGSWPPPLEADWLDLGLVDSRETRRRALERLEGALPAPRGVVAVVSATNTPDRGVRALLEDLRSTAHARPVWLLLSEGQRLRQRGHPQEVEQRFKDWRELAHRAGIQEQRVVDVDLEHLTDASRRRLEQLLGAGTDRSAPSVGGKLEPAFGLIIRHAEQWHQPPSAEQQAALHRELAKLYGGAARRDWQTLLGLKAPMVDWQAQGESLKAQLGGGAARMVDLLPPRLRRSPSWLAAGGLAGAMGCVAAATLVTPAALASLPLWAGLGSALSLALPGGEQQGEQSVGAAAEQDLTAPVRGAALFTLVLELQGRDETTITRIIDRVAREDDPPLKDPGAARAWLEELRHRLDLVLTEEGLV